MTVWITGDTHNGERNPACKSVPHDMYKVLQMADRIAPGDILIICGDAFGTHPRQDPQWLAWFDKQAWTTLFVEGNHDNYTVLAGLPTVEMFGGQVGKMSERVFHLRRGHVYTIEGKTFLAFGGGMSVDQHLRHSGINWWPEEIPTQREVHQAFERLAEHDGRVDYILSHAAPRSQLVRVGDHANAGAKRCDTTCYALQAFWDDVEFTHWYCGHYHMDQDLEKISFLYQRVLPLP